MSLISAEQVPARAQHPVERLELVLALEVARVLPQHLGDADDGVERRAQLVAHVGEELRLVPAGDLELPALLLDLVEQPRVLDRQHRLRAKVWSSSTVPAGNSPGALRRTTSAPTTSSGPHQRHDQPRPIAGAQQQCR